MKELTDLIKTWRRLPPGTPAVLATVVATSGSTYRRPGARMLLTPDGWAAGSISGGCLEGDVVQSAWERTGDGPALVTYDATADEDILWGFGLGCNGLVQVLLERLPADGGVLAQIVEALTHRQPLTLATIITPGPYLGNRPEPPPLAAGCLCPVEEEGVGGGGKSGWSHIDLPGYGRVLIEHILPPLPLVIFGAGHDAIPLVAAAKALGWHVTVVDPRSSYANAERIPQADVLLATTAEQAIAAIDLNPRTAAVVMAHHYLNDLAALRRLLPSPAGYVGVLGPTRRGRRLLEDLRTEGYVPSDAELSRFHSPIGLDLGADGPDEIALAIVAEIQSFFRGRRAGYLTGEASPLHARDTTRATGEASACGLLA